MVYPQWRGIEFQLVGNFSNLFPRLTGKKSNIDLLFLNYSYSDFLLILANLSLAKINCINNWPFPFAVGNFL